MAIVSGDLAPFPAVARHGNFRRAAAEMGCTPSALSHALRALEDRLDLRLFNRTTRSVALTDSRAPFVRARRTGVPRHRGRAGGPQRISRQADRPASHQLRARVGADGPA